MINENLHKKVVALDRVKHRELKLDLADELERIEAFAHRDADDLAPFVEDDAPFGQVERKRIQAEVGTRPLFSCSRRTPVLVP